jgi:hypothetical protein
MAKDLREVLSKYVPQAVLDSVVDEVAEVDGPEWYRAEAAKLGAKAKRADELEAQLGSITKAPKREALAQKLGVDVNNLKKAERHALDQFTWDGDEPSEDDFAKHLAEWEIPTSNEPQAQQGQEPAAARIAEHAVSAGQGRPPAQTSDDDFYRDLDSVEDGDREGVRGVLVKHGRTAPTEG